MVIRSFIYAFLIAQVFQINDSFAASSCIDTFKKFVWNEITNLNQSLWVDKEVLKLNRELGNLLLENQGNRYTIKSQIKESIIEKETGIEIGFKKNFKERILYFKYPDKILGETFQQSIFSDFKDNKDRGLHKALKNISENKEMLLEFIEDRIKNHKKYAYAAVFYDKSVMTRGFPVYNYKSFMLGDKVFKYLTHNAMFGKQIILVPDNNGFSVFLIQSRNGEYLFKEDKISYEQLEKVYKSEFSNKTTESIKLAESEISDRERRELLGLFSYDFQDMWAGAKMRHQAPKWFSEFLKNDEDAKDFNSNSEN